MFGEFVVSLCLFPIGATIYKVTEFFVLLIMSIFIKDEKVTQSWVPIITGGLLVSGTYFTVQYQIAHQYDFRWPDAS